MTIDYAACHQALASVDSDFDASECHGVLCGLLCAVENFPEERWLKEMLAASVAGASAIRNCAQTLKAAHRETQRQLSANQYEFAPMLPGDEAPLPVRGEALASWCRGFLYGLALGGVDDSITRSSEVREVLGDFSEFTRIEATEAEAESNSMETDYAEIVEYVRVGVMLVHSELQTRFGRPPADETLH